MTKADVVVQVAQKTGIEAEDVSQVLEILFKVVKDSLIQGKTMYFRGFGRFTVKKRAEKTGRNIFKNTAVHIPEQLSPMFKPAKQFVAQVRTNVVSVEL